MQEGTLTTDKSAERESARAARVLDMLDQWSERLRGHCTQKREFPRRRFRARVAIYISESEGTAGESEQSQQFDVWSRNISQGGLGFIYEHIISAQRILVCLDADSGGRMWYHGEIVRCRQVHDGFWEYGARFTGSAQI